MRTATTLLLSLVLVLGVALAPREASGTEGGGTDVTGAESADACVRFWGEVRYGALGYNHLVHIANSCSAEAECVVSTNVSPEPQKVTVEGKSEVVVTTFLGSPARAFTPRVKCTML